MEQKLKDVSHHAIELTRTSCVFDLMSGMDVRGFSAPDSAPGWFGKPTSYWTDLPKMLEAGINAICCDMGDWLPPAMVIDGSDPRACVGEELIMRGDPNWFDFAWPPEQYRHLSFKHYDYHSHRSPLAQALTWYDLYVREIEANAERMVLARSAQDIDLAQQQGKIAVLLTGNSVRMIEDSLEVLRVLYRLGYRVMLLARDGRNLVADSYMETRADSKLTTFGLAVVKELNHLGIVIDVSHLSDRCIYDVLELSSAPVIASHCNARALCNYPRNLTDDQAKALASTGGVIGLTFPGAAFIDLHYNSEAVPPELKYSADSPLFQKWLDHCDHFVELIGIGHVAIGSDGGVDLFRDRSEQTPRIVEGLLRRGYSDQDIKKIIGQNALRVIRQVIG
ncbi:MAG: hypothetical protein CVU38_01690 [Chloroflexi bacterium HGW-Chloroflexi-1]|nr:MAG: hypothetical protein CVU38_01690 [Chloroflexi bacterium HGW-Chloroflexi-1]